MTNLFAILSQSDAEATSGGGLFSFALLPLMLVAMYFLIIRPNSKKRKAAQSLQSELEVGDEVMTTSGIIGTLTGEDGPTRFWLEIDDDVQVRISRGGIQGKIAADDEAESRPDSSDDGDEDSDDPVDAEAESATDAADKDR
ncbi:MAG: preprotein translocase subunit YajC [Ilumatobacter sp.]|jgi:preprotein translocase subunit YajC